MPFESVRPLFGLGVDPGLSGGCGMMLVERRGVQWRYVRGVTIKTTELDLCSRLREIDAAGAALLDGVTLSWLAVEDPYGVIVGKQRRRATNAGAMRLLVVIGQALGWGIRAGAQVMLVEPGEAKRGVGASSNSDKERVRRCVQAIVHNCPDFDLNESDAGAVAIVGGRQFLTHKVTAGADVYAKAPILVPRKRKE